MAEGTCFPGWTEEGEEVTGEQRLMDGRALPGEGQPPTVGFCVGPGAPPLASAQPS